MGVRTAALWGAISLGCATHPTQPSDVPLGRAFELRPGTSAALSNGLRVTFEGVPSDSRCPMDAICVWAGDAVVAVRLSKSSEAQAMRELHTQPNGSEASYLTYTIKLVALAPYPRSGSPIRPGDYVATLAVDLR
jgi:hypothetical protein